MTAPRMAAVALATVAGVLGGLVLARRYLGAHRAALFSPSVRRRHAALGFIAGHPAPAHLRLLHDYLAWERRPALRRRGRRVMRDMELALG
ncbi:MAG TPA: hypothetical protein VF187_05635 [Gemmatimonadales bacterium]